MAGVLGFGIQPFQLCSSEDNLAIDEGIAALTETQSVKILRDTVTTVAGETDTQDFVQGLPHGDSFNNQAKRHTSSNLLHLTWSETRTTEEGTDDMNEATMSLQDIIESTERLKQENSDLLQFLAGIGSDTDTELMVNPWSDGEFHSQSTESSTLRNTEEIQPFGESSRFRAMCDYNYMTTPMPSCSAVQQCNSISVVENVKEMTELPRPVHLTKIECIEVGGPALPHTKTVVALGGTTEEVTKQEEKKQRRRERNRECSRQFRQKQKIKEHTLTEGLRVKKTKLKDLHMKLEVASKMLFRIVSSSAACNKGRSMINAVAGLVNKENWPEGMQVILSHPRRVSQ